MLTDEVRKFTDDDIRAAVKLLETTGFDIDLAIACLRPELSADQHEAAEQVLRYVDFDYPAARQLLIVTNSFREVLSLKSS